MTDLQITDNLNLDANHDEDYLAEAFDDLENTGDDLDDESPEDETKSSAPPPATQRKSKRDKRIDVLFKRSREEAERADKASERAAKLERENEELRKQTQEWDSWRKEVVDPLLAGESPEAIAAKTAKQPADDMRSIVREELAKSQTLVESERAQQREFAEIADIWRPQITPSLIGELPADFSDWFKKFLTESEQDESKRMLLKIAGRLPHAAHALYRAVTKLPNFKGLSFDGQVNMIYAVSNRLKEHKGKVSGTKQSLSDTRTTITTKSPQEMTASEIALAKEKRRRGIK